MRRKELKVFLKILKPKCLGNWNCIIMPNPENLYYEPRDGEWSFLNEKGEVEHACPFWEECRRIARER